MDANWFSNLEVTGRHFTYPADFDPTTFCENNYGTPTEPSSKLPVQHIRILVWEKQNFYFRNVPLHESQVEVETCKEYSYSIFDYFLQPTHDFIMTLRSFGNDIEVLSPRSLREEMIQGAKDVLDEYAGVSRVTCKNTPTI